MNFALYEGKKVRLSAFELERDPQIEAEWSFDGDYCRSTGKFAARPQTAAAIKKEREEAAKKPSHNEFEFALRDKTDGRLVGRAQIYWIEWAHRCSHFELGIGNPQDRGQGYGSDALRLLLNFAFNELNLHRVALHMRDDARVFV